MDKQDLLLKTYSLRGKLYRILFGLNDNDGLLVKTLVYVLLVSIGYIYLYPILYMFVTSFMSLDDILNSMVKWIPTSLYLENYRRALNVLHFKSVLFQTIYAAGVPAVIQTAATAVIGYGFARFKFPGKSILFVLMLSTFIIPPQVTMIPTYLLFKKYHLLGTIQTFIYPALVGQGLKSSLFILIFYQFFRKSPVVLDEAAQIDGAGYFKIFYRIALPMSVPAIIIVFLFSFVWYWNDTYLAGLYFGNEISMLPLRLQNFVDSYTKLYPAKSPVNQLNEAIKMAGTLLTISPLLVVYFILQRWFVEGVDRSGITGE